VDGSLEIGSLRGDAPALRARIAARPPDAEEPDSPQPDSPQPDSGELATPPAGSLVEAMLTRRSISKLAEPGPTEAELDALLHAATTVPDHGGLRPWRFVVVRGEGRARVGDALAAAAAEAGSGDGSVRDKAFAAPALIAVVAAPKLDSKIPEWEQTTSASTTGYAIALAAHGLGLGASWCSTEHMDGSTLRALLGMAPSDRLLGWVNLGRPVEDAPPTRRDAPDLDQLVTRLG
jgi:nitroreductase